MSISPFIFILDLDGTIIGDCMYQLLVNNIDNVLKNNAIKLTSKNMLQDCYHDKMKLLRPFFVYFINTLRQYNQYCQFYIYTASEKSWATKEIILIEKANNIKFNRPIFARNDCIIDSFGMYKKSVDKIMPRILKNNKGVDISKKNILVIDNNKVFIDYFANTIICPSYEYIKFCDLWEKFNHENLAKERVRRIFDDLISSNKMCQIGNTVCNEQSEIRYKWYYKKCKKINKFNRKYSKDLFWKKLADSITMHRIESFDSSSVSNLQKLSCSKL